MRCRPLRGWNSRASPRSDAPGHLPVLKEGRVIGILSIGDLLKEMLSHHERLLKQLATERITLLTPDPSGY
jgi:CBS domain-containing protein